MYSVRDGDTSPDSAVDAEIAAQLFVSPKTVEATLSRVARSASARAPSLAADRGETA